MVPRRNRDRVAPQLTPQPFLDAAGNDRGWQVGLPGRLPLATPAVVDGRVFLGGGFGSYDFFALRAETGELDWHYATSDDGPTAAVVAEGHVVFNTESCELEVLTVEGEPVWKKWLGDPLMSTPAVHEGAVYMAFPDSRGNRRHHLACFDLRTGEEHWRAPINGEIITTPVISERHVYLTTLDGTLYCFECAGGRRVWERAEQATSSPVVVDGFCYYSQREEVPVGAAGRQAAEQWESCSVSSPLRRTASRSHRSTRRKADYLDYQKRESGSTAFADSAAYDANVGFGGSKGDSGMDQARRNLGHGHVASVWAYQGSKPFYWNGHLYSAPGDTLQCVDLQTEEVVWSKRLEHDAEAVVDHLLTPPALVNEKVFVGTAEGDLWCLSALDGRQEWRENVGQPVVFQPAVVGGHVYVSTAQGTLLRIATGDPADDGWQMWGATAAHNGLHEIEQGAERELGVPV